MTMESAMDKALYVNMRSKALDDEGAVRNDLIVCLIEIREAIEGNTAVQQQILDRQADAETAFRELAENLGTLMHDVETVRATMKLHGGLMESIGQIQTEHAETLAALAEEKKPAGPTPT